MFEIAMQALGLSRKEFDEKTIRVVSDPTKNEKIERSQEYGASKMRYEKIMQQLATLI